ncbi:MAG: peptide ABC transporter permease [Coxiella sp. RIFCSPHIGHO2_12_FULL_44_14]|nr:MAG: peptide ABC transporter permease [Coxiella sp. RIFCSPHIGHO2_12_FULL_44_14]
MEIHWMILVTDGLTYILLGLAGITFFYMQRHPHWRTLWEQLLQKRSAMITMVIISFYVGVGLLDSIHFQVTQKIEHHTVSRVVSVLDMLAYPMSERDEQTYSAPFSLYSYHPMTMVLPDGKETRIYPRLQHAGKHLVHPEDRSKDIVYRVLWGIGVGSVSFMLIAALGLWCLSWHYRCRWHVYSRQVLRGETEAAWRAAFITVGIGWILVWIMIFLFRAYHILGTDQVGEDVFYEAIKSIRTGLLIGTLTTLFLLPFALFLGTLAGYWSGWVDDIIQYFYTVLSSIPAVLLIAASVLVLQVYIANHPTIFPTLIERADARLLALCIILGVTGWATLCRLLRGETLKIREQEFVQAAQVMRIKHFKIILRHIVPNVMHILLITLVLNFSELVLAEAVLSYIGVGVDPTTPSWGNMINGARMQLSREPIVWWPLLAALIFMFVLVLAANVLSDAVRDVLDPRLREMKGRTPEHQV